MKIPGKIRVNHNINIIKMKLFMVQSDCRAIYILSISEHFINLIKLGQFLAKIYLF